MAFFPRGAVSKTQKISALHDGPIFWARRSLRGAPVFRFLYKRKNGPPGHVATHRCLVLFSLSVLLAPRRQRHSGDSALLFGNARSPFYFTTLGGMRQQRGINTRPATRRRHGPDTRQRQPPNQPTPPTTREGGRARSVGWSVSWLSGLSGLSTAPWCTRRGAPCRSGPT